MADYGGMTVRECQRRGWYAGQDTLVQRQAGPVKADFLGYIDMLALDPVNKRCHGIQYTSGPNHAAHKSKWQELIASPKGAGLRLWLRMGNHVRLWSWSKRGERGARKLWTLREETFCWSDEMQALDLQQQGEDGVLP